MPTALDVACPLCKSEPGVFCVGQDGKRAPMHHVPRIRTAAGKPSLVGASKMTQRGVRRRARKVTLDGERATIAEHARRLGTYRTKVLRGLNKDEDDDRTGDEGREEGAGAGRGGRRVEEDQQETPEKGREAVS